MLRAGEDSAAFAYWLTTFGHVPKSNQLRNVAMSMLENAVGAGAAPVGRTGITFQVCPEVPLPTADDELQEGLDYNFHGSVFSDSPLTEVSITVAGGKQKLEEKVTFDATAGVQSYSLDSEAETVEQKAVDNLVDLSALPAGKYTVTITAKSTGVSGGKELFKQSFKIVDTSRYILTQNKFDDNYNEANAFFGGRTEEFLFHYSVKKDRSISTENDWREKYLQGDSKLGRVHETAVPYFDKAYEYLTTSYICVTCHRVKSDGSEVNVIGRVTPLMKLMKEYRAYVPRFQSNLQFLSHHTLGTAMDVNDNMYPNTNVITNHELIGTEVRDYLTYNGIKTDDKGQQYYDFTYTGSYPAKYNRVPTSIINYLLYELAFFRAGFQWGYYYETACDAMHYTLTEHDINRHNYSDTGLRKVYSYYN